MNRSKICQAALAHACFLAGTASAADVHTQPQVELRVEQNDNFGLVPGGSTESDVYGYIADAQLLIDMETPRGDTTLRPRVKYQDYPDRDDLQKFEGFVDLRSQYRWERANFDLFGHFSHQDLYSNETAGGDFDPVDPGGGDSDSGEIVEGETRDEFELQPTFEHRITERASIGFGAELQATRYDADEGTETKTDFDFGLARSYVTWALNPNSDFDVGIYGSKYEATDNSEQTDAVGAALGFKHRWSERVGMEATLFFEENDITETLPVPLEETTSNFGGYVTAYRRQEVSEWQFSVGRTFVPTGDRGKSELDQMRLQYDRQLSQRLSIRGVGRYESRNSLGGTEGGVDRDFARIDASIKWLLNRNWYVGGGYTYMWEDRETAVDSADNNKLFLTVGYQGLANEPT